MKMSKILAVAVVALVGALLAMPASAAIVAPHGASAQNVLQLQRLGAGLFRAQPGYVGLEIEGGLAQGEASVRFGRREVV